MKQCETRIEKRKPAKGRGRVREKECSVTPIVNQQAVNQSSSPVTYAEADATCTERRRRTDRLQEVDGDEVCVEDRLSIRTVFTATNRFPVSAQVGNGPTISIAQIDQGSETTGMLCSGAIIFVIPLPIHSEPD